MIEMIEVLKEKSVALHENIFFELVKKAQYKSLNGFDRRRFLISAGRGINYLEEEFETVRENENNNGLDYITINNGLTLVSDLSEGFEILRSNFIKENINQFSAHYQSVKEYEEAFLAYRENSTDESYDEAIEKYEEAIDYSEAYTIEKTLTKC